METSAKPNPNTASQDAGSRAALEEAIGRRARELYDLRGRVEGHDLEDWLQAEAELTGKIEKQESLLMRKLASKGPNGHRRRQPRLIENQLSSTLKLMVFCIRWNMTPTDAILTTRAC